MQEEIFGPILPILEYEELDEAIKFVNERPKPLALYFFSRSRRKVKRILRDVSAGGVTINDALLHFVNPALPFGGVGDSGIGAYHGQHTFEVFSHHKAVLHKSFIIDPTIRYAPYAKTSNLLKRLSRWFG